jgi:predicted AlkP superfamily phosphohydrolase/phosphomutase/tetratricopeptide (TPR) repeat protein
MKKQKVVLIGWDAADWQIISPLLDSGEMPALEKLINNGMMGNIMTLDPPLSPILWTSIATGKHADKHGVLSFSEPDSKNGGVRPVTLASRKTRAIWNILNSHGYKSNVISWWPSHPAEPINGIMVSNFYQHSHKNFQDAWPIHEDAVYPRELLDVMADLRVHKLELTENHILPFIPNAASADKKYNVLIDGLAKVIAEAASTHAAVTWAMENNDWDFTAVYYDAIDHICHGFMRYYPPKLNGISDESYDLFNGVVKGMYKFHDMMLDRIMELAGEDALYVIVSDHGFQSGNTRLIEYPKFAASPAMDHRPYGMLVFSGPGIRKDDRLYGATLLDVAPTILSYLNLPVGSDMDGKTLANIFEQPRQTKYIESWDLEVGDFGTHDSDVQTDAFASAEAMQQLIELGYIEDFGNDKNKAQDSCKVENGLNLALVYNAQEKYLLSEPLLEELIRDDKDNFRVYFALAECYLNQKKLDKAEEVIKGLRNFELEHLPQVDYYEGILYGQNNQPEKALSAFKRVEQNSEAFPGLSLEMGRIYNKLEKYNDATRCFNKVIQMDETNSNAYLGKGYSLLRQEKFEEAAEYLLTSIGLTFNFAPAHFYLGEALYKMEKFEDASNAFEMVLQFTPKHRKACQWLEKIYTHHLTNPEKLKYYKKMANQREKGEIIVVSGLPRSGTSLMMQILETAGIPILTDNLRKPNESNPKGYYEHEAIKKLARDQEIIHEAKGRAVKIIAQLLTHVPQDYSYKVIFMERDINEVIQSQMKMLGKPADLFPVSLVNVFKNDLAKVKSWIENEPYVNILYIQHQDLMTQPEEVCLRICEFLDLNKDEAKKMSAVVDKSLYRSK